MTTAALIVFLLLLVALAHTFLLYPLVLWTLARLGKGVSIEASPEAGADPPPFVSIVFSAYNEEAVLAEKLENCLALDWPRERIEIAAASDESEDGTDAIFARYEARGVRWTRLVPRMGKNPALNALAPSLRGDIWIFTDANTMLARDAVRRLAAAFADPRVGLVCGQLDYRVNNARGHCGKRVGALEMLFWRWDQWLKRLESRLGFLTGANGGLFAMRREVWRPEDAVATNDFMQAIWTVCQGRLAIYEPRALAVEAPSERVAQEFNRRARIAACGMRAIMLAWREAWKTRRWLLLYGLIGRKWPRRLLPLWLIGLFASNAFLLDRRWAQGLFAAQTGFYLLCAASGLAYICGVRRKWLLAPFYFIALNAAVLAGLWRHWRGGQRAMWRIERPQGETPPRLQGDCLTPCEGASCANENSKDSSVGKRQHPKTQP